MTTGIQVSKNTNYGVVGPPKVSASKVIAYAVVAPAVIYTGIDVSKLVAYTVVQMPGDFTPTLMMLIAQRRF